MVNAFKYFQTNLNTIVPQKYSNKKISDYLVSGNWCFADKGYSRSGASGSYTYTLLTDTEMLDYKVAGTPFVYDSYVRLSGTNQDGYQPTLKCTGTVMETFNDSTPMYVATLTADEITYAGGSVNELNYNYYLMNEYSKDNLYWWSLSPRAYGSEDFAFYLSNHGGLDGNYVGADYSFRPAISLKSGVEIVSGGMGTKDNPYEIK